MKRFVRYPKHAPPVWAYTSDVYARIVTVRTPIGTLLTGTPAQLEAMGMPVKERDE